MELLEITKELIEKLKKVNQPIDEEMIPFVDVLNRMKGISTSYSCAGHGLRWPMIHFKTDPGEESQESLKKITKAANYFNWLISVHCSNDCKKGFYYCLAPAAGYRIVSSSVPAHKPETEEIVNEVAEQMKELILHLKEFV